MAGIELMGDIRKADKSDLKTCLNMGLDFCQMAGFKPDYKKIESTMMELIEAGNLIVHGRPATGMIGGVIYEHYFNKEVVSQELFWWVTPKARGGAGIKLLKAFEDWSKENGADKVMMISLEKNDVSRIYLKRGYTALEQTYMRLL